MKNIRIFSFINSILPIVLGVFVIRVFLSFLPSFEVDMNAWLAWANRLRDVGAGNFYSTQVWTQYTPLYLYWLWVMGSLGWVNELAIKIPVILADIATGLIIWRLAGFKSRWGAFAFLIYVINPVMILTGSVWGQVDAILTLLMMTSVYSLTNLKKTGLSGLFFALSFLLKPQAIALVPGLVFIFLKGKFRAIDYVYFIFTTLATLLLVSLPFFPKDPVFGLPKLFEMMTGFYHYTSVFAFNFWTLVGMWKDDSMLFAGISYYVWGLVFYASAILTIFLRFFKENLLSKQYLVVALCLLASFLFPTRVHERYIFPMFAFLLASAVISKSKTLLASFMALSFLSFLNIYHPYAYYSENFLRSESLLSLTGDLARIIGVFGVGIFVWLIWKKGADSKMVERAFQAIKSLSFLKRKKVLEAFPEHNLSERKLNYLLIGVLCFSFVIRIWSVANPSGEYFDEVYHAFTARQMLHGNVAAWEWWNTPPEGFAYEWTHPPIAKFGMVLGMLVFGENSFGWRIPGVILGVVSTYLVYLIARHIFKDKLLAIFSAFIFSLDGISLVISRIGMNDVYFLTFALLSLYFFLKYKNFFSAFFFGLSFSSKWSAVWLLPILVIAHFAYRRKLKLSYLFFIFIPPLIYLASYIPFFTTGHNFNQFLNLDALIHCLGRETCEYSFGVQQQMWWYHTHLNATHPYTSPWWSWPLNIRSVYLYTSEVVGDMVSRIYLIGNPIVSWAGVVSAIAGFLYSLKTKRRGIGFVCLAYFIFFVPWALSPRIMFLYHYLPSIPFMAIALAYFLRKNLKFTPVFFVVATIAFIYFYPHWAGINVPTVLDASYYWLSSWR